MTTQQAILRACNHSHQPCEVNLGTNRKPEVINVCSECWNKSVYAARDERKAQLAEHWKKYREVQAAEMQAAGQREGDRVSYFCASLLGIGGYVVTGVIKLNRNRIAIIKFDCPQNGKTSTEWAKGWKVIV